MKKFLTMLLALSVVFTYTFGATASVFADTTPEGTYAYRVGEAEKLVQSDLTSVYNYVVGSQLKADTVVTDAHEAGEEDDETIVVEAANTKSAVDAAYADLQKEVSRIAETFKGYEEETYSKVESPRADDIDDYFELVDGEYVDSTEVFDGSKTYYTANPVHGAKSITQLKAEIAKALDKTGEDRFDASDIEKVVYTDSTYDHYKAKAQAEADKAATLDVLSKIDLSMYGTDAIANNGYVQFNSVKYYNYNAAAKAVVDGYKVALAALTVPAITSGNASDVLDDAQVLYDACATDNALVSAQLDENSVATGKYEIKLAGDGVVNAFFKVVKATGLINNSASGDTFVSILTKDKVAYDNTVSSADKASYKAALASDISNFLRDPAYIGAVKADKEVYDKYIKAYEKAVTYGIENLGEEYVVRGLTVLGGEDEEHPADFDNAATKTNIIANVELADKAVAALPKLKATKNADGKAVYYAEKLDDNLVAVLDFLYSPTNRGEDAAASLTAEELLKGTEDAKLVVNTLVNPGVNYVTAHAKAVAKAEMAENFDAVAMSQTLTHKTYYALEWKDVEVALAAYNVAVDLAETDEDIDDAADDLTAALDVAKIKDTDAVDALYDGSTTPKGKLYATAYKQASILIAYAGTINAGITDTDALRNLGNYVASVDGDGYTAWATYFAAQGARTDAEIVALHNAAIEMLNAIPTNGEAGAAKKAIEETIAALPVNVTLADKATVKAAYEAYAAYKAVHAAEPSNLNTLKLAIYTVGKLEKAAAEKLQAEVKKIDDAGKLAVTDKAQAKVAADAINEYNADCEAGMYTIASAYLAPIANPNYYVEKIRDEIELVNVKELIDALPTTVKLEDKAQIEAARAAYDVFVAEYETVAYDAKDEVGSIAKLTNAEAQLAVIEESNTTLEEALKAAEEAKKAAEEAKAAAEAAKAEAEKALADKALAEEEKAAAVAAAEEAAKAAEEATKAAEEAKAEAEKAVADKAAAEEALKAAEEAKKEAEEKAAAAEEALKVLETKLAVKDSTARFATASTKVTKTSIALKFKTDADVAADGYKVYMATSKNGTYKLVGTTTGTTFTKKSLKAGKTYYFKVKAYKTVGDETVYTQTSGKYAKKTAK